VAGHADVCVHGDGAVPADDNGVEVKGASAESGVDSGHFAAHSDLAQLRHLASGRHRS
jgi:hypothetical protein